MTALRAGGATDTGRVRSINQDDMLVANRLFVVADGMGGHLGGEVASAMAVDAMRSEVTESTSQALLSGAQVANRQIFERANEDPGLHGMGTTLCAIALVDNDNQHELAVINVGDSRAYLLRDQTLTQITRDHSLIEDLREEGRLSEEELAVHPHRNVITRALGIAGNVEVDEFTVIPHRGDRLVICSDGLFNEVPNDKIAATLRRLADPGEAAHELVRQANENGGRDNITCIVIDVVDDDGRDHAAAVSATPPRANQGAKVDLAGFSTPAGSASLAADSDADLPAADKANTKSDEDPTRSDDPRHRRMTWRVAGFVVLLAALLAATAAVLGWYARGSYYVGLDDQGEVTIYQGRAEGFLWFQPTAIDQTRIPASQVPEQFKDSVSAGKAWGSRAEAEQFLANIRTVICKEAQATRPATSVPGTDPGAASTTTVVTGPTTTLPLGCDVSAADGPTSTTTLPQSQSSSAQPASTTAAPSTQPANP